MTNHLCISTCIIHFGIVFIDAFDVHHTCDEDVTSVITTLIRSITLSSLVINTSGGLTSTAFIHSGKHLYLVDTH